MIYDELFNIRMPINDIDELYKSMVIYERCMYILRTKFETKNKNNTICNTCNTCNTCNIYDDIDEYITSYVNFRKYINNLSEHNKKNGIRMYIDASELEKDDDKLKASRKKIQQHFHTSTIENFERSVNVMNLSNQSSHQTSNIINCYSGFWKVAEEQNSLNIDSKINHDIEQSLTNIYRFYERYEYLGLEWKLIQELSKYSNYVSNFNNINRRAPESGLYLLLQMDIYKGLHELIIASLNDLDKYYDQELHIKKPAERIIISS